MNQKRLNRTVIVFLVFTICINIYVGINQGFSKLSILLIVLSVSTIIMTFIADQKRKQ